MQNCRNLS